MKDFLTLFNGVCDQTKELQTLSGSMSNDVKWIISSSGGYMFVRFAVNTEHFSLSAGFLAKVHYGNEILNQNSVQRGNKVTVFTCGSVACYENPRLCYFERCCISLGISITSIIRVSFTSSYDFRSTQC